MQSVFGAVRRMERMLENTRPLIGIVGERVLRRALLERVGFAEMAAAVEGLPTSRTKARTSAGRYAWRFREALELLAAHWSEWNEDETD